MKFLLTGGAGFIGSHLTDLLLKEGHQVIVLDDFSMGKYSNLPQKHENLLIFGGSILEETTKFLHDGVDVVFHLAALTRPRESFTDPIKYNLVNVEGTLRTLLAANEYRVKKFIFVSSASTYGFQREYPFIEEAELKPVSPYATTKLIGEKYCQMFARILDMNVNIVRPFNVYGLRQDPEGPYASAVSKFIDHLTTGQKPFITGDGKQFRDFVYIKDVVDFLYKLSDSPYTGEIFNIGSGSYTTIEALYQTISELLKKNVEPDRHPEIKEPNTLSSMEKAYKYLNWTPRYSLIEGLLDMIGGKK